MVASALVAAVVSPTPRAVAASRPLAFRGVVEGFYGTPFSARDRLSLLRWMLDRDMNIYIRAPKNDPFHRLRWRQPYPRRQMRRFAREIAEGAPRLRWVPAISPGLAPEAGATDDRDICFSCAADREVLVGKLDAFWAIGARSFMVSFDDVLKDSSHPEDDAAYGMGEEAYGRMQGDLLNGVYARYRARSSRFELFTVPSDYAGFGSTPYLDGLRATLRPEVRVLWTGERVVSPTIECGEANAYAAAIGRRPIVWDNFPVNDYAPEKLMIGPYAGRAPDLPSCVDGVVANPMPLVQMSRIPLDTVAAYLRAPASYEPGAAWQRAVRRFARPHARMLLGFLQNVRSTPLERTEAAPFTRLRNEYISSLDSPWWPPRFRALVAQLERQRRTPGAIRRAFSGAKFLAEIDDGPAGSWLARLAFNARNGLEAAQLTTEAQPRLVGTMRDRMLRGRAIAPMTPARAEEVRLRLESMPARDDGNPESVHGDRLLDALGVAFDDENRMDEFYRLALEHVLAYETIAENASSVVTLRVAGRAVPVDERGRFSVRLPRGRVAVEVVDGVGRVTQYLLRGRQGSVRVG